ncbi:MAG: DUF4145 domain-containing protein [Thaumarchaeota archaeon]|nr:DUF4145 domain-containing protein [Nitrososphaerota archaeon]
MGNESVLCPHCGVGTAVEFDMLGSQYMFSKVGGGEARYSVNYGHCQNPQCGNLIIRLKKDTDDGTTTSYVVPRASTRIKFDGIPPRLAEDYEQARAVLDISPAASAALARRCLQGLLHEHFSIKEARLHEAIKKAADLKTLPPHLADGLGRIREIGNLAAHPTHSDRMGVIVDVRREEAEWTLEILESLFKHCYVEPGEYKRRTQRLREKLDGARADAANPAVRDEKAASQNLALQG